MDSLPRGLSHKLPEVGKRGPVTEGRRQTAAGPQAGSSASSHTLARIPRQFLRAADKRKDASGFWHFTCLNSHTDSAARVAGKVCFGEGSGSRLGEVNESATQPQQKAQGLWGMAPTCTHHAAGPIL